MLTRITGTLHAVQYTFMIISLSILLRTRNVSENSCRENQKTHFVFNNISKSVIYEITWKNTAEAGSPQMAIWRMRIACWMLKATITHSEYVILLFHCNNGCMKAPLFLRYYVSCLSCSFMCTPQIECVLNELARLM